MLDGIHASSLYYGFVSIVSTGSVTTDGMGARGIYAFNGIDGLIEIASNSIETSGNLSRRHRRTRLWRIDCDRQQRRRHFRRQFGRGLRERVPGPSGI